MSPEILGLHHAQITAPSALVDDARGFYLGVLGLTEIPKPSSLIARGGFWVRLGDIEIHVSLEDGVQRQLTKSHLAFRVSGLREWRKRIEASGCVISESIPIPGMSRFEFRDPFGNRLELLEIDG